MLLCDGCDRGHHLYCLKPKLKKIPSGDWFCHECKPKERVKSPKKKSRRVFEPEPEPEPEAESEEEEEAEDDEEVIFFMGLMDLFNIFFNLRLNHIGSPISAQKVTIFF